MQQLHLFADKQQPEWSDNDLKSMALGYGVTKPPKSRGELIALLVRRIQPMMENAARQTAIHGSDDYFFPCYEQAMFYADCIDQGLAPELTYQGHQFYPGQK